MRNDQFEVASHSTLQIDNSTLIPMIPWWAGGLGIGAVLIAAVAMVQPIGVSTQYVVAVGVLLHRLIPVVAAQSPYLVETAEGWSALTYEFMFVVGVPLGALCASLATGRLRWRVVPFEWKARFGSLPGRRLVWSFIGGFILLFGARFGGGCTSGHMISGVSQLAVGSLVFSGTLFVSAIVTARWVYGDGGRR
jgi:uncharacterized membrane protein YedE/YeeE